MSSGAYTNKPERRIRHLKDVLSSAPRTFDVAVIGAGRLLAAGLLKWPDQDACESLRTPNGHCSCKSMYCRCRRVGSLQSASFGRSACDFT